MQVINQLILQLMAISFTNFSTDFINYSFTPFQTYIGFMMWPVIFAGVFAFIYVVTENVGSTVAAILITFALFGTTNAFIQAPEFSSFFFIISALALSGLILTIFIKRRFET